MRAKNWVKELQRQASPSIVIALSGNKADLAGKRMVDFEVCMNLLPNIFSPCQNQLHVKLRLVVLYAQCK